ncbi:hypothetical protein LXL04_002159 [Taraxacum kok-saghyz]
MIGLPTPLEKNTASPSSSSSPLVIYLLGESLLHIVANLLRRHTPIMKGRLKIEGQHLDVAVYALGIGACGKDALDDKELKASNMCTMKMGSSPSKYFQHLQLYFHWTY